MLLLVLIQFDISYYGSSEAYTKVALEIEQTGTVSFAPPFPFLARGLFSFFSLSHGGDFQLNGGSGRVGAKKGCHLHSCDFSISLEPFKF